MSDIRFIVKRYIDEQFGRPHPMPKGEKGPRISGWQNPERVFGPEEFREDDNVGTALTHSLVDIDLDCDEAVAWAADFLKPTGRVHGRASKPRSHYFYRIAGVSSYKFKDIPSVPPGSDAGARKTSATLLEIRAGADHQTMIPPSLHPSGERLEWVEPCLSADEWESDTCFRQSRLLATTVLLGRHWAEGSRHDTALAVGGFLAGREVTLDEALNLMQRVLTAAGDPEVEDRLRAVKESYASFKANDKTTGLPKIKELLGEDVAKRLGEWFKVVGESVVGEFRLTEAGDADRFAEFGKDVTRHDHRRGVWLVIDRETGIWSPDEIAKLTEMTKALMRWGQREANNPDRDIKDRKRVFAWYVAGESRARIANCLALARSVPPIANRGDDWDVDPWLLGTMNGVVDLRTGEHRTAKPEEHISKRTRTIYDPAATCPLWLSTLSEIFSPGPEYDEEESRAIIAFLQRALGYSLTGDCREECCFITWGAGANGKGTIINTVGWLLGDYRDDMPYSTLEKAQHGAGIPNDVAKLFQKRFVTCAEVNEFLLNESRLKALTGRDPMTARFLNKEWFTFIPVCKIWMATNNRPQILGQDDGIWRRIHLIPFLRTFVGKANMQLKDQLLLELPGILRWMIEGARQWQEQGLNPPKTVRVATEEYRHESNPVTPWVSDRCVTNTECRLPAAEAFKDYEMWCSANHIEQFHRLTDKSFHRAMRIRFAFKERVQTEKGRGTVYFGVGLISDRKPESAEPPKDLPF